MNLFKNRSGAIKGAMVILTLAFAIASVSYIISPGLATHTATLTVTPNITQGNTLINFTLDVKNDNTSIDPIHEVRLYYNESFSNYTCYVTTGWFGPFYAENEYGKFCLWTAQTGNQIDPGYSEDFKFSAITPETECGRQIRVETRDKVGSELGDWNVIYTEIAVDKTPPETTKSFSPEGTYKIAEIEGNIVEWIDTATIITINATDSIGPHDAGIAETYWRNTLLESEEACWSEARCAEVQVGGDWNIVENPEEGNLSFTIEKDTESCHLLEFYSIDNVGNEETIKRNCFFVDKTAPKMIKTVGDPKVRGDGKTFEWWVRDHVTPITLDCDDSWNETVPHPSGDEEVCYKVSLDSSDVTDQYCPESLEHIDQEGHVGDWCCVDVPKDIIFEEDSLHDLEWFCRDAVDKKSDIDLEWFKVDSQPPIIEKDMFGSYRGDCPSGTDIEHGDCYVADDGSSGVDITVYDNETYPECVVGGVTCEYELWWETDLDSCVNEFDGTHLYNFETDQCFVEGGQFGEGGKEITFTEDSTHTLKIWCSDALGNEIYHKEEFLVDSQPPTTIKWFGEPNKTVEDIYGIVEWINSSTPIYLNATDVKVGVNGTFYNNTIVPPEYCREPELFCHPMKIPYTWEAYTGQPIYKAEDSCHMLIYWSNDSLGNTENWKTNCFFVDNTPPAQYKEVGQPNVPIRDGEFDYWVTMFTPIKLNCIDPEPHPVDQEIVYWRFSTNETGQWKSGPWNRSTDLPVTIYFPEDSFHDLEFYCTDHLGNANQSDTEYFIVEGKPPVTTKTYEGPFYTDGEREWIDGVTLVNLTAIDQEPHPSGVNATYYRDILLRGEGEWYCQSKENCEEWSTKHEGEWTKYTEPFNKTESCHVIEFYSVDNLGNKEDVKWQCVFVDKTPPVTTKEYKGPIFTSSEDLEELGDGNAEWTQEEKYSGSHSAKLVIPDNPSYGDSTGVDSFFDVFIGLDEISSISYYRKITQYDTGWTPLVILGIDADGDSVFEAKPLEWEAGTIPRNPALLGDDSFIQCEATVGPSGTDASFVNVDAYSTFMCYTPTADGTAWDGVYQSLSYYQANVVGKIEPTDKVAMIKIMLNVPAADNEVAYVDYVEINGKIVINEPVHWITSDTEVLLSPTDQMPHPSGVKATYWRDTLLASDEPCYSYVACQKAEGSGGWNLYEDPFFKKEESCHLIEYYSVDNVGKTEKVNKQCVFVDNSAPEPLKEVGEPKAKWDGADANFYDIADKCWSTDPAKYIECWKVTMFTPITLGCVDPTPHPVDHEIVCFKIDLDGEDATEDYCTKMGGAYNESGDGYCCMDHVIEDFKFDEETEHNLKYYCIDALGNKGQKIDEEKFKVEGAKFEIPLYKKWNLVSVPFVLLDNDINEVFKDIKKNISSVWKYDNNTWYVWTPDDDPPESFDTIDPGYGYWVLAMNGTTEDPVWLTIGGSLFSPATTPPSRDLVKGWNLIGYYGSSWELYSWDDFSFVCGDAFHYPDRFIYGDKVYCALNSLIDTQEGYPRWSSLWSYISCGDHHAAWLGLNACADRSLQQLLDRMYAGRGYWVEMDVEDMYSPATTCIWNEDFECRWTGGGIIP